MLAAVRVAQVALRRSASAHTTRRAPLAFAAATTRAATSRRLFASSATSASAVASAAAASAGAGGAAGAWLLCSAPVIAAAVAWRIRRAHAEQHEALDSSSLLVEQHQERLGNASVAAESPVIATDDAPTTTEPNTLQASDDSAASEQEQLLASADAVASDKPASVDEQQQQQTSVEVVATEADSSLWATVQECIWENSGLIALSVLAAVLSSAAGLAIPSAVGSMIDVIGHATSLSDLWRPSLSILGLGITYGSFSFAYYALLSRGIERFTSSLRKRIFSSMIRKDIGFFDKQNTGELVDRLSADVEQIRQALKHTITMGVRSTTAIVGGVVTLSMISAKLTLLMGALLPTVVCVGAYYTSYLRSMLREARHQSAKATDIAQEILSSIRTVRLFANEAGEEARFGAQIGRANELSENAGFALGVFIGLVDVTLSGIALTCLWYGGKLVLAKEMTTGALTAFMLHSMHLQNALSQVSILYTHVGQGVLSVVRIGEVLAQQPKIPLHGGRKLPHLHGVVRFHDVDFRYPTRDNKVLHKLSLQLEPGKVVALVGKSGSGKSTIMALIERFYDPEQGTIALDDVDLRDLDPTWLRQQIGVVTQEPLLFARSIADNIAYGCSNVTREQVIDAARHANCHDFIEQFPDGYDTMVGDRGVQLSGGQKQRIAIARAILKNPRILILDEATSSLDTASEQLVQEALKELMQGRTVLVIAHRLSTVRNADQIVVLRKGCVVEVGKHDELLAHGGVYSQLVQQQQGLNE